MSLTTKISIGGRWKGVLALAGLAAALAPADFDGLWAIAFGNGSAAGPVDALYFLAGPSAEQHGLFGSVTAG